MRYDQRLQWIWYGFYLGHLILIQERLMIFGNGMSQIRLMRINVKKIITNLQYLYFGCFKCQTLMQFINGMQPTPFASYLSPMCTWCPLMIWKDHMYLTISSKYLRTSNNTIKVVHVMLYCSWLFNLWKVIKVCS